VSADLVARRRRLPAPLLLAITLIATIAVATVVLRLPVTNRQPPLGWIDTLFMATSAACVTGLTVVDVGTQFNGLGQAVILLLIEIGGIGVVTIGTLVILAFGYRPTTLARDFLRGVTPHHTSIRTRDVLGRVVTLTLGVQLVGAGLLFAAFVRDHAWREAAWLAVFHSASAFCNAGLTLWPDSLSRYVADPLVNLTMIGLILAGGLGFVVLLELWAAARLRLAGVAASGHLTLHARLVLGGTLVASVGGALAFLAFERGNVLADRPVGERLLVAAFQSVTTRTAGFSTVDIGALTNPTLLVVMVLMFTGAGPGSTAGGVKLPTMAALAALVVHRLRGRNEVRILRRAIGTATLERAVVMVLLALSLIAGGVIAVELAETRGALDITARGRFFDVTFEVVSAFATVGLSMDFTTALGPAARMVVAVMMFAGRLGPLSLMDFFARLPPPPPVRYASEDFIVG